MPVGAEKYRVCLVNSHQFLHVDDHPIPKIRTQYKSADWSAWMGGCSFWIQGLWIWIHLPMGRDGRGGNPFLVLVSHRLSTNPPGVTLGGSIKFVNKKKRWNLQVQIWIEFVIAFYSKIKDQSMIFTTFFFQNVDLGKIGVLPRREHDFRGLEPRKIRRAARSTWRVKQV